MEDFIDLETIFINLDSTDKKTILEILGNKLCSQGYVNEDYTEAVISREESFPTGLNVEGKVKVAIPHADSKFVNSSQLAFASLITPVKFNDMGNPEELIDVQLVFMLAVKDSNKHVVLLQKLMEIFQNQQILNKLVSCSSKEEIKKILSNELIN